MSDPVKHLSTYESGSQFVALDLEGQTAMVTGASSGLGFETALQLGARGADVILACRSEGRGQAAAAKLRAAAPRGVFEIALLDVGNLQSVRAFADRCKERLSRLHMLCNNAGVVGIPLSRSPEGFEQHMATNYFGPFALTGLLLDILRATPGARVVNISSQAHRIGKLPLDDLDWQQRRYKPFAAYAQSKLAITAWTLELDRRLQGESSDVTALLAHPGFALTGLAPDTRLTRALSPLFVRLGLIQSAADGARSSLYALTSPQARGGDYIGPDNYLGSAGLPARHRSSAAAADAQLGGSLWTRSIDATGVSYLE